MTEEWRSVCGFEGLYEVSSTGKIRSLDRYVNSRNNSREFKKGVTMKAQINHKGYMTVVLHKENKPYSKTVHRIVAEAFLENKNNLPQINHKDTNKTNNNASNLEWISNYDNMQHAIKHGCYKNAFTEKTKAAVLRNQKNAVQKLRKPVTQCDRYGNKIRDYKSITEAGTALGISSSHIGLCCKGKRAFCGGFKWKYKED